MTSDTPLTIQAETRGRALFIDRKGSLYIARKYRIFRSDDGGATWNLDCYVPTSGWKPVASTFSLAARALRFNIQAFQVLADGSRVAVARDGIYRAQAGESRMTRSWAVTRGSRPITLSAEGNRVFFGEYGGAEMDHVGVRVYLSEDGGRHFEPFFEFPKGDIHHIHNVVVDPYADHYWVLAGDHGRTPGIAALSKDGRHLDWLDRGHQMVRAVSVLPRPDHLIYGSDSEVEPNFLIRLDKKTAKWERLLPVEGSSLYAADVNGMAVISTSVESSAVNTARHCSLYASHDDATWTRLVSLEKDLWSPILHFGLIVLPTVQDASTRRWMFSGQALKRHHDRVSLCG
ncbi:hypothetical protein GETHLI_33520 [Geothrix limicola]|uniref:Exo-alpha-sialidase n=1 Tax=Geothrix limicola TaxID=2927978 RepID=A0ABQ5QKI9_9BACT|nr:hypothetical protein [Geothrix limicola]GLH74850.1 hypothetical protein GETHLI_33520 [Geothrix limicola]